MLLFEVAVNQFVVLKINNNLKLLVISIILDTLIFLIKKIFEILS